MAEEKVISLLTMCRRAGKLLLGFDAVKDAGVRGQLSVILLAADVSPRTEKEIRFSCGKIPIRKTAASMDAYAMYFRKRTAVLGVTDAGFAGKLLTMLPAEDENVK